MKYSVSVVDNHDVDWHGNAKTVEFEIVWKAERAAKCYREHFPDSERYSITVTHPQLGPVGIF